MPWQGDRNVGRCSYHTCPSIGPRCDGFMCAVCCVKYHQAWRNHKLADGTLSRPLDNMTDSRLPAVYGGADQKSARTHPSTDPPEWDYDGHPPEFGESEELDAERVYLPLSNYRASKDWPADYVG